MTDKATSLNERVAAALAADRTTVAQIDSLRMELRQLRATTSARMAAIRPGRPGFGDAAGQGPERSRALAAGEDVSGLDDEHKALVIAAERIEAQEQALTRRRQTEAALEAVEGMPKRLAALTRHLDAVEAAQTRLAEAWRELDEAHNGAFQARVLAVRARLEPKAASAELVSRLAAARAGGVNAKVRLAGLSEYNIREELGAPEPEQVIAFAS